MRGSQKKLLSRRRERLHILEIYVGGSILHHIRFGQGQDVIFLHGWGGSTASFLGLAKALSKNFCVTLVDFYGFGKTPHPDYPLFVEDYAKGVVEIVNFYKMNKVCLVGHSFGGRVAIRLASKYGYLLEKVVLIDSAGVLPRRGIKYYYKVYRHKLLRALGVKHEAGSTDYRALSETEKQTFKNVVNEDLSKELHKVTLPVVLIWGNEDKDTPIYMAKRMKRRIPDSALIILKGAGHFSYLEAPGLVENVLNTFFGGENEVGDRDRFSRANRHGTVFIPLSRPK